MRARFDTLAGDLGSRHVLTLAALSLSSVRGVFCSYQSVRSFRLDASCRRVPVVESSEALADLGRPRRPRRTLEKRIRGGTASKQMYCAPTCAT